MKLTANPAWLALSPHCDKASGAKFLRIMKLTTIIILAACLHTSAKGVAQQTITFSGKEVSLENVFNAIKKQTNYRFFFNTDMLTTASKVTLDVKNAQVEQVMNMALKDQPLTFTIKGRTIFVMKKPEEEKKSTQIERTGDPITVSGRVTDENGEPLVGANVKVKGGSNGVTTDGLGRFTLNNVDPNASLEISFVGHDTQTLPVRGKTVFSVALGQKVGELDETVVIAYGTTTRRFNTGNVSSVKASDIEKQPVNNPLLALQGKVPGLVVTQQSGLPGSGVSVLVQGQNSILKGNDPFYVIDGVPYTSQLLPNLGSMLGGSRSAGLSAYVNGNPLSFINPSDIESIDVLKDADATAIYGSRAANGAILITTKKGKAGKTKTDLNFRTGWGKVNRRLELLNTRQFLDMRYEALKNDNISLTDPTTYAPDLKDWDTTKDTDWQKELIGGTAKYTNAQVTVSGGNSNTQFLVGGGFLKETTVFPGDLSDKKGSLHFSVNNISLDQKFKLQLTGSYVTDNNTLVGDLTGYAVTLAPNAPYLLNEDGSLNWAEDASGYTTWPGGVHPLSSLFNKYKNKTTNLVSGADLSYKLVKGLELGINLGYTNMQTDEIAMNALLSYAPADRPFATRSAKFGNNNINSWIVEPQIKYIRPIGKGRLEALLGGSIQENNSKRQQLDAKGFNSDLVLEDIKSASSITVNTTINSVYKYNAIFGRINYNLKDKYIINLTARRDGSSRFGSENMFHNFGSVGGAWIFSNENLLQRNASFLSFGKLRASFGSTGNDQIGDYQFLDQYITMSTGVPYQGITSLQANGIANPYLQWESTKKFNAALDLGFLSDKIFLSANYFRNRSSNQLLSYFLPIITGVGSITSNFPATVQNSGWEFSISSTNIKNRGFEWSTDFNLTIPKNELVAFPNISSSAYANIYTVGKPISSTKAYHFLGVDPATGVYYFADSDGVPTFSPKSPIDQTAILNNAPKFYGGFHSSIAYKGFKLEFTVQFVKQKGFDYSLGLIPGSATINQPNFVLDRWRKTADIAHVQRYNSDYSLYSAWNTATANSDANWSDASFARMKNLSLSWQLPHSWSQGAKFHSCLLYLQGQNIFTITSYKGLDPETKSNTTLPPLRTLTIGIQITL